MMQGAFAEVPELMQEIMHRVSLLGPITLSNGRVCTFTPVSGKLHDPTAREDTPHHWFMFDARFETGGPDHLEFTLTHTGGGGFVTDPGGN